MLARMCTHAPMAHARSLTGQGLAMCSVLLVTALSTIDVQVREKETVALAGVEFSEVS